MSFLRIIFLIWSIQSSVTGIYFFLSDSKPLCFIEDVPQDTLVKGVYQLAVVVGKQQEVASSPSLRVHVTDPDEKPIHSRSYSAQGQFVFTSHKSGDYSICLSLDTSTLPGGSKLRVDLDIRVADHAINYGEVAARDKLNELQLRVRQLMDQVHTIGRDQNYQRVREAYFRHLSESTSQRVTYWSIGQLILLVGIGFWQMRHLRAFFHAKKLV